MNGCDCGRYRDGRIVVCDRHKDRVAKPRVDHTLGDRIVADRKGGVAR